jgi:hypothetical protein
MLTVVMTLLDAFALHYAVRRVGLPFLGEVILLAVCFASLKPILTPRPWLFPNLFFEIELFILFQIRKTGRLAFSFVLPILFAQPARTIHLWFRDAHTFCLRRLGSETPTNGPIAAPPAKAISPIRVTGKGLEI